ncbi:hypothetical protein [Paenibacillus pinistramenti]|uniref:hypothetical protein n=1 Tax=Paenibacillus pinistramenti TaxID=1768003 RepID=UPI00110923B7|nr:hypothetical protein [Paenibacillus pinistramenti]
MIGFNTILPLSLNTSETVFLELCRKWQMCSPHSTLKINNAPIEDGLKYQNEDDSESLEFTRVVGSNGIHCGVRHIKKDEDGEWRTDVIGYKTNEEFKVAIVTSRASFNVANYWRLPQKPYIVKLLLEETGPMLDGDILIEVKPKEVKAEDVSELASLINGERAFSLPVVYISKHFLGDYHLVDPDRLALKLSGLAHVYFESDTSVSTRLREITEGKNPYNGKIGVFWPGGDQNYYYRADATEHITNILDFVKKTLNTRKTVNECRWSFVQNLKYQSTYERFKKGESEQQEFIEYASEENQRLKEQIESLEAENRYLNQLKDILSPSDFNTKTPLLFKGNEPEIVQNEHLELIKEIIEDKLKSGSCSVRTQNILKSILESNEISQYKDEFLNKIKSMLSSADGLTRQSRKELIALGFEITEEGKHYKMKIRGDDRYSHSISKTPSDSRSAMNNFSEFKERFFGV